jgi:hypothetical protein
VCHAAPGQVWQGADRGKHPLAARRCVQGGRLAEQRQERPNRVVPASQCRAHRRVRRAVIVGHELFNQIDRADNDCPRRDSLHRRPQRSDIKPGAGVLGSGELVKQHPARAGDRLGGLLQPRQHRQPLPGRRAAGRAEQPGRHQQRQQVQRVIDRGRLQVRTTATSVAVRFGSPSRASAEALLPRPVRASTCCRLAGMSSTPTRPAPSTASCSARCSAMTISGPELRRGERRSRSSSDTRDPSGTRSRFASRSGSPGSTLRVAAARAAYTRGPGSRLPPPELLDQRPHLRSPSPCIRR